MDAQKPQNGSGIGFGYSYSGTVIDFNPAGASSTVSGTSSGAVSSGFDVPKLVYEYYGLDSNTVDITYVAEVSTAVPRLASMKVVTSTTEEQKQPFWSHFSFLNDFLDTVTIIAGDVKNAASSGDVLGYLGQIGENLAVGGEIIWGTVSNAAVNLWGDAVDFVKGIPDAVADFADDTVEFVKGIPAAVTDFVVGIPAAVTNFVVGIPDAVASAYNNVVDWAKSVPGSLYEWGSNVVAAWASVDSFGDAVTLLAAPVVGLASSVLEGGLSFIENVADALIMVKAIENASRAVWLDIAEGVFTGEWDLDSTRKYFNDAAKLTAYDATGAAFTALHEWEWMKTVDQYNANFGLDRDGVVYGITKEAINYAAVIALGVATGGASIPASTAAWVGVDTFGETLESEFGKIYSDGDKNVPINFDAIMEAEDASFNQLAGATAYSACKATADAAVYYFAASVLKPSKPINSLDYFGTANPYATPWGKVAKSVNNLAYYGNKNKTLTRILGKNPVSILGKATKPWIMEGVDSVYHGDSYDFGYAFMQSAGVLVTERVASAYNEMTAAKPKPNTGLPTARNSALASTDDAAFAAYQARNGVGLPTAGNSALESADDAAFAAYQARNGVGLPTAGNSAFGLVDDVVDARYNGAPTAGNSAFGLVDDVVDARYNGAPTAGSSALESVDDAAFAAYQTSNGILPSAGNSALESADDAAFAAYQAANGVGLPTVGNSAFGAVDDGAFSAYQAANGVGVPIAGNSALESVDDAAFAAYQTSNGVVPEVQSKVDALNAGKQSAGARAVFDAAVDRLKEPVVTGAKKGAEKAVKETTKSMYNEYVRDPILDNE